MAIENPYQPPVSIVGEINPRPLRRGVGLLIFLILASAVATFSALMYLIGWSTIRSAYPGWAAYFLAAISTFRLISVLGLWLWSRAALILYILLTATAIVVMFSIGMKFSVSGVIGVAIVIVLFRKHWAHMPWLLANNSFKPKPLRGSA